AAEAWWRGQAQATLALGVEGIKADDGEGWYVPEDARLADGTRGGAAAWPRRRVRAQRLERPAGDRRAVGRRPGQRLLVAAGARRRGRVGGAQRLLELVARRRRLPRGARGRPLPARAAAPLGAGRLLHAADAGPRPPRPGAVDVRRADARPVPR